MKQEVSLLVGLLLRHRKNEKIAGAIRRRRLFLLLPALGQNVSDLPEAKLKTEGGHCGVESGNVTAHIPEVCNGKSECTYTVDQKVKGVGI